ncbi:hypothetical protein [Salinarchaeum sp. Harcht-Bsk1]|uniref:hypothetical protein n=1 Tax=Salinarchaeum sp. Harcht-Bsk1 TaxID=1333523 RepID=UPI001181C184|nr:hypothetical protein [Salinarchaeum sp. Harcht-Bsk1]
MAEIGDHYRSVGAAAPTGTYRVVGTTDTVCLLRVTNEDGRRRHTGEVVRVSDGTLEDAFEPTTDPDAGIDPIGVLSNLLQGLYWSARRFF